jgi:4-hydroxyacetophenone monooxygenase
MNSSSPDRESVIHHLTQADTTSLLLAVAEKTGDLALLRAHGEWISDPLALTDDFPADIRRALVEHAADLYLAGALTGESVSADPERFRELSRAAATRHVSADEERLFRKEMGLLEDAFVTWDAERPDHADDYRVVIVGAGLSGIATAVHLKRMGIDFTIYERLSDVGGTWLVNTYPGCGVDILSHYFSYSFHRRATWSRYYSPQQEVLDYLRDVVREFDLGSHIRCGVSVDDATFDAADNAWVLRVTDAAGTRTERADVLVAAVGALSAPAIPDLPGMDTFAGDVVHSAAWDPTVSVTGKRVALIGNGASANQLGPHIADDVAHLTVVTRSAQWVAKAPKYGEQVPEGERWALAHIEPYARWFRIRSMLAMNDASRPNAIIDPAFAAQGKVNAVNERVRATLTDYIAAELGDRQDLLPHLVPDFPPGMKRMLRDNGWPRMFRRSNVELVPSRAVAMDETGLIDGEGAHHDIDVAIFATGFEVARMVGSLSITGTRGTLREAWGEDDPRAFMGITVPGFPNLFILYGPNTNVGVGGSIFFQAEAQSLHIARAIRDLVEHRAARIEVREDAYLTYNEELDAALDTLIWALPLGSTWYRNSQGRVVTNMPWTSLDYWTMNDRVGLQAYTLTTADGTDATAPLTSSAAGAR